MSVSSSLKKRILFVITQSDMGGAQRFLVKFTSHIHERYEIKIAVGSDGGPDLMEQLRKLNLETVRLKFLKRNINPADDIRACFEIRKLIRSYQPDDLFLLSSKAGFVGSLATVFPSKINHLRVIYRIGGWTFNDPWPDWKKNFWLWLEKFAAGWKDIIIVNNSHDLKQAQELSIKPRQKVVLAYNGIDPYNLDFLSRDEAKVKLFERISRISGKIFQADTIIGTVANFYPAKGISFLIEAAEYFKNNPEIVFIVIGDGIERPALEKMINEKNLDKKIFLVGAIKDGYKYMPAFDVFVSPSVKEGFPFAILEAMSAKLPVIATRVGAVPEIIENGKNGFIVEPANPAPLAGKIKELLSSDHLLREFSIQAHQTVLFKFSEEKMVKEIETTL